MFAKNVGHRQPSIILHHPNIPDVYPSDQLIGQVSAQALCGDGHSGWRTSCERSRTTPPAPWEPGTNSLWTGDPDHRYSWCYLGLYCPLLEFWGTLCWHYCLPYLLQLPGDHTEAGSSCNGSRTPSTHKLIRKPALEISSTEYNQVYWMYLTDGGVIFLPYLNGERTPYWDPAAQPDPSRVCAHR